MVSGIYKIWLADRIDRKAGQDSPQLLRSADFFGSCLHALYFSVLSAFNMGWRDLNVGSWIAKVQSEEYSLRATGWVRSVSGVQALISIFLLAQWALTQFGRPFG